LFVGYGGPAGEPPAYTIGVILEESGFGGTSAAPVARWVLEPLSGQVPLPPARTVAEQAAGPAVDLCPPDAFDPETSTTTTSAPPPSNPLVADACPDDEDTDDDPSTADTAVPIGPVD